MISRGLRLVHTVGGVHAGSRIAPVEDSPGGTRALFVLGSPRSGTTLIGSYLASGARVLDLGEYGGFHLAHTVAPATLGAMPGSHRAEYLA